MQNKIEISQEDLGLLELSLAEQIYVLKNRFAEEDGYIHPSKKYEDLHYRLTNWLEPLPVSTYSLSATQK